MKNSDYIILGILLLVLGVWYFKKQADKDPVAAPPVKPVNVGAQSWNGPRSGWYNGPDGPAPTAATIGTANAGNTVGNSRLVPNH